MSLTSVLSRIFAPKPVRTVIDDLRFEVRRNWEQYHVFDQQQSIRAPYRCQVIERVEKEGAAGQQLPASFAAYAAAVRSFNVAMKEMKEFEAIYTSSLEQKTKANAEIFHHKQEVVAEQFKASAAVIMTIHKEMFGK